jgi:hypothetical protein
MSRYIFGIHGFTPYNRTTHLPYGTMNVLGGANLEMTGETEDLFGGSSKFAYASEQTQIGATMTLNVKSYPDFLMELFLGGSTTAISAAANGEVRNFTNKVGTSVSDATTGIASVGVTSGDEADAKFGRYVVKVKSGGTDVDVYLLTDIDFNRGTQGSFDSTLLIADDITIPDTDGTVDVDDYGLEIHGWLRDCCNGCWRHCDL